MIGVNNNYEMVSFSKNLELFVKNSALEKARACEKDKLKTQSKINILARKISENAFKEFETSIKKHYSSDHLNLVDLLVESRATDFLITLRETVQKELEKNTATQ